MDRESSVRVGVGVIGPIHRLARQLAWCTSSSNHRASQPQLIIPRCHDIQDAIFRIKWK